MLTPFKIFNTRFWFYLVFTPNRKDMAGKPKRMSQIKQLLRMHLQGKGIKHIARTLSISKNTVKGYLLKVSQNPIAIKVLLNLEDTELEAKLLPGNPAYKDLRYETLKHKLEYYSKELKRVGVTRMVLREEYIQSCPDGYGNSQFCYHLHQYLNNQKPSMVLSHNPGEKLYIDYAGKKLSYVDRDTGEVIAVRFLWLAFPIWTIVLQWLLKTTGLGILFMP